MVGEVFFQLLFMHRFIAIRKI